MIALTIVSGFVLAFAAPWLHRIKPEWTGGFLCLLPLTIFIFFLQTLQTIITGQPIVESYAWLPALGINLSFYLDGLSLLFALLISGIGTLIVLYSGGYLHGNPNLGRFYLYLLVFMASMLGVVLSANAITLFIFWELTSLSSYFLIGFEHERESARTAALQALLVTGIGGLALLAGFVLMGDIGGGLEINTWIGQGPLFQGHPHYFAILVLVLLGAFTKSAQFPFHFWLPSAMEGPAPVSAYLHSATMVKAGVYLLMRLNPVLGGTAQWQFALTAFGAVTMIGGAWLALMQRDMKRLLAYSTVNGLGTMVFLTGIGSSLAIQAAIVFLLGHALYKGSLFMTAGIVDHATGSRDVTVLGGLYRKLPLITIAAALAGLSMAGLPPLLGFVSKELIYEAVLKVPWRPGLLTGVAVAANTLLLAATGIFLIRPFFSGSATGPSVHHRPTPDLWIGPLLPAAVGLILGIFPHLVDQTIITPAATAVLAQPLHVHLALWHGFNPMLALSALTVACGAVLYAAYHYWRPVLARWNWIGTIGPEHWYEEGLHALKALAGWQTRILQSGYLHRYVLTIILTTVTLLAVTMISQGGVSLSIASMNVHIYEVVITILMMAAAMVTVGARSRLTAIVAMGVIGYGIALIFIWFGAPDLAMTQFIIETMTVILFALVIYRLPRYKIFSTFEQHYTNAIVAVASGALMTVLVLVALNVQEGSRLSAFFSENSLLMAHGRNIVNVIIVDFRGMDTLGEITVLSLAGMGVYTLLKLRPHSLAEEEQDTSEEEKGHERSKNSK